MNINETKDFTKKIFKNNLSVVPAYVGVKGIGKTEALKQVAEEMGIGYQAVYPSSLQGEDFMGLLIKDLESKTTRYLAPDFFPTNSAVKHGLFPKEGVFVLEELNRADTQTISALFPLLLERKINGHELADGWRMAVSMNPESMEYTTNTIDNAGMDRILPINVNPDLEEYASYMIKHGLGHDDIMNFLFINKEMLNQDSIKDNMGKSPSPRGWTKACEIFNHCTLSEGEKRTVLNGLIGPEASASFIGFMKDRDIVYPVAEEILKNYDKKQQKIIKKIVESNRYDIMHLTLKKLSMQTDVKNEKHITNLGKFLADLDYEMKTVFAKQVSMEREDPMELFNKLPEYRDQIIEKLMSLVGAA